MRMFLWVLSLALWFISAWAREEPLLAFISPRATSLALRAPADPKLQARAVPSLSSADAVERLLLHRRADGTPELCDMDAIVHVQASALDTDAFAALAGDATSLKRQATQSPAQMVFSNVDQSSSSVSDELSKKVSALCTGTKLHNIHLDDLQRQGMLRR